MKTLIIPVMVLLFEYIAFTVEINGEQIRGMPCVKRLNQLYCRGGGSAYPSDKINKFVDDNKALVRRMFGELQVLQPQPQVKTPASTTFVRNVRNFGGIRFKRSVLEGYIEDLEFNVTRPKRQADFPGPTGRLNTNKIDACESITEVTTPYWATNSNGEVRAILNTKQFNQAVHQEICGVSKTLRCAGDCSCEQKYKWHRLLAYDPNNDCSGIFMDWFLFPSCCTCRCFKSHLLGGT